MRIAFVMDESRNPICYFEILRSYFIVDDNKHEIHITYYMNIILNTLPLIYRFIIYRLLLLLHVYYNVSYNNLFKVYYSILIKEMIMALYRDKDCQSSFFHPKRPKNGPITIKLKRKKRIA